MPLVPVQITTPDSSGYGYPLFYDANPHRYVVPAFLNATSGYDVDAYWYGHVMVPSDYGSSPAIVITVATSATSGAHRFEIATAPQAEGETLDPSYTTETAANTTVPGTTYFRDDISTSLTSSPAAGDLLLVRVGRIGSNGGDTLTEPTLMMGCHFSYTAA